MPYYDFKKKPPRKESVGPEEGYGSRGRHRDRSAPQSERPASAKPSHGTRYREEPARGYTKDAPYRPAQPARPAQTFRPAAPARPSQPIPPAPAYEPDLPPENMLVGRNPIREALRGGRDLEKLLVAKGDLSGSAREIVSMAKERHIIVQEVDRVRLDALSPSHQGLIAFASAYRYATLEDMFARAEAQNEAPFLILLDGVTDPHNLGAIIRTAECAGAHGVILPERRAVGLTPAAVKASAGAIEHVPVARTGNLTRMVDMLKERGIWVTAACMDGEPYDRADLSGPVALVVGGEGTGVSRLVAEHCDRRVALPLRGRIESLNASVAAGILMYEVARRRQP